jgi:hypothetical protein
MGSVKTVEGTVADFHGVGRGVKEKPAVCMSVRTGSDKDLVFDETLFGVYHRSHLLFS